MKKREVSAGSAVPLPRRFGYRFSMVASALGQHMLQHVQREHGLNIAEYRIMTNLRAFEAPSIRDIAKHSQLDKAHVTRALAVLIDRGLVTQIVDPHDRRLRVVRLTPAGQTILNEIEPFAAGRQKRLEGCLSSNEIHVLDKALSLILSEAEQMLAESEAGRQERQAGGARSNARQTRRPAR